jgi:hypothetical protein
MILPITFGVGEVFVTVLIQAISVVIIMRRLATYRRNASPPPDTFLTHTSMLAGIMIILFLGHVLQIFAWALPFWLFGQFANLTTAFYHSAVNYTSLGYGDIVMDDNWRLLGPLEAANGILMFGVSTAAFFAIMSAQLRQHSNFIRKHGDNW